MFPPKTPLRELSIAQQQMVEIAKALSLNARILIMDEPTSSLTLTETGRLLEVIKISARRCQHHLHLAPPRRNQGRSPTASSFFATAKTPARSAREEISHDNIVKLMVGRDIERFYKPPPIVESQAVRRDPRL